MYDCDPVVCRYAAATDLCSVVLDLEPCSVECDVELGGVRVCDVRHGSHDVHVVERHVSSARGRVESSAASRRRSGRRGLLGSRTRLRTTRRTSCREGGEPTGTPTETSSNYSSEVDTREVQSAVAVVALEGLGCAPRGPLELLPGLGEGDDRALAESEQMPTKDVGSFVGEPGLVCSGLEAGQRRGVFDLVMVESGAMGVAHIDPLLHHAGGVVPPVCARCEGSDLRGDGDAILVTHAGDRSLAMPPQDENEVGDGGSLDRDEEILSSRARFRGSSEGAEAHERGDATRASQEGVFSLDRQCLDDWRQAPSASPPSIDERGSGVTSGRELASARVAGRALPPERALIGPSREFVDPVSLERTRDGHDVSATLRHRDRRSRVRMPLDPPIFYGGSATELSDRERAAAHFLGFIFGRLRSRWSRRPAGRWPAVWRPVVDCRCGYGLTLAMRDEFEQQAARAREVFDWDRSHVDVLRRLESGRTPLVLDLFCGAGCGMTEGARRMGGAAFGRDLVEQPHFVARYGEEWFGLGDALDRNALRDLVRRLKPIAVWASPPCEGSSTLTFGGEPSKAPRLIAATRDMLEELGLPFVIENVLGAASEMRPHAIVLRGQDYGLETERPRLIEAGGGLELRLHDSLKEGGRALRDRCCLGARARYDRLDRFGLRFRQPCCGGNIFAVMGDAPRRSTLEENARALGLDATHASFSRLAKAIPPAYGCDVFGQIVRHVLRQRYGLPAVAWDEARLDWPRARRLLAHWRRGAGDISPHAGVELVRAGPVEHISGEAHEDSDRVGAGDEGRQSQDVPSSRLAWQMTRVAVREIDLSYAGACEQAVYSSGARDWLNELRPTEMLGGEVESHQLMGQNTFIHVTSEDAGRVREQLKLALQADAGTRAVVVCLPADALAWRSGLESDARVSTVLELGGTRSIAGLKADELLIGAPAAVVLSVGERLSPRGDVLVHADVETAMDPVDLSVGALPKRWKQAVAFTPYPHPDPAAWRGKGFPPHIERLMTEGARVDAFELEVPRLPRTGEDACGSAGAETAGVESEIIPGRFFDEHGIEHRFCVEDGQYAYPDAEHFMQGVTECDRALLVGHLEPVPSHLVDWALAQAPAHPWTIVHQSSDKWRAAQDYSRSTNSRVGGKPFTLPTVWDAARVVKAGSHFAKFDLRDGFWGVKVAEPSRPYLMVRHPATGRLLWCRSLPFGYKLSPLIFCDLTEHVGQIFRSRMAGCGVHLFVFVDDFLLVGDSEASTRRGMIELERLFDELGLHWARHKRRGPARVMEFLGMLLVNLEGGMQVVSLTSSRQERVTSMVDEWLSRRPSGRGGRRATASPHDLASLLGHLVFCSDVIPGGRTYMQAMLRQFVGLEVDWMRGAVRHARGCWRHVELSDGFWRDLVWWRSALQWANCKPMREPRAGVAAITGTDASDGACGELAWIGGAREEMVLRFTTAERRRPINFRELLGVVRLVERWGARLRGHTLLIDIDNTAAVGAAAGLFSQSEDMQELVRRLLDLARRHSLTIRPVHTPGAMLDRPDQTSRGAPVEEPRARLRESEYRVFEARYGPFTEFIGAEREFGARTTAALDGPSRLWVHPTHSTVATALSRIGERLTLDPATCPGGLVVVPWSPEAAWWPLTRHFECVARYGIGSRHLEINREGRWGRVSARRATAVLAFPRLSGTTLPLSYLIELGRGEARADEPTVASGADAAPPRWLPSSYSIEPGHEGTRADGPTGASSTDAASPRWQARGVCPEAPLPSGTLLYSSVRGGARDAGDETRDAGALYLTLEPFDGYGHPACAWLRRSARYGGRDSFTFSHESGRATSRGGSYDERGQPFRPVASSLWVVNSFASQAADRSGSSSTMRRFSFDFVRAERELSRRRELLSSALITEEERRAIATAALELGDASPDSRGASPSSEMPMSTLRERSTPSRSPGALPLRRSPTPPARRSSRDVSVTGQPLVRSTYAGMRCAGCDRPFGELAASTRITPGGSGMIHNSLECLRLARRALEQEAGAARDSVDPLALTQEQVDEEEVTPDAVEAVSDGLAVLGAGAVPRSGSMQRRSQLAEKVSEQRRGRLRACLRGECGVCDETPMVCLGEVDGSPCCARLHGQSCAQITKGHASLGCFTCPACRLRKLLPGVAAADFPEAALREAEVTTLLELSTGAEATGSSYFDFKKLEREFMESVGGVRGAVMPSDDPSVFKMFLSWMVTTRERALSLDALFRAAGSIMARTGRENLTKRGDVKAFYESLRSLHGEEAHPRTAVTRRMVRALIERVLPDTCKSAAVRLRSQLMVALETMCGLRVGEALSGGDYHGVLANHLVILRPLDADGEPTGDETVEILLEHSKTGHKRWVNALGTSRGAARVPLARLVREYWAEAGFTIISRNAGGYREEGPDYSVLRLSLVALTSRAADDEARFRLVVNLLRRSRSHEARRWADYVLQRGLQRMAADSLDKRYINVVGGVSTSEDIQHVAAELSLAGFGAWLSIVPGPFMRATHGDRLGYSHMPIQPGSTYEILHRSMDAAFAAANEVSPDPELDLQGLPAPQWGHHSFRRGADTVARQTRKDSGATEADIDLIFGWNESFYSSQMQLHYESTFDRTRRTAVTSLF